MWWKSAVNCSFFLCLAACRMRSSAWDTLSRFCARRVLCCPAFPSVPALGSPNSALRCPALFVGFIAVESGEVGLTPCLRPLALSSASVALFRPYLPLGRYQVSLSYLTLFPTVSPAHTLVRRGGTQTPSPP